MHAPIVKLGLLSLASSAIAVPLAQGARRSRVRGGANVATVFKTATSYTTLWVDATAATAAPAVPSVAAVPSPAPVAPAAVAPVPAAPAAVVAVPSVAPAAPAPAAAKSSAPVAAPVAAPAASPAVLAQAAASPAKASAAPAASPASYTPASTKSTSGSVGKAGVAFTDASVVSNFVGKGTIGWAYNWNAKPGNVPSGIKYIPLLWGAGSGSTGSWVSDANAAISNGADAVMGFNEPDHAQQANMDPNTAAAAYKQHITSNFAGKVKLVSPSVTNGAAPMGLAWLSTFMSACSDCKIDAINIHWYDSSSNIDYFKSYIEGAYKQFNKPIWLTEFGTTDGNDQTFLKTVQPWLEQQAYVERYAYFMAESGKLLTGNTLNAAGQTYASA